MKTLNEIGLFYFNNFKHYYYINTCSINSEQEASNKIKELLDNSDYENILICKGESQNWKVTCIVEYTDIWEKDSKGNYQYNMVIKRNWTLVYKGEINEINKNSDVNCYSKSPINGYTITAGYEDGIFVGQNEREQNSSIPRGQKDWNYNVILTWYEKNKEKKENIPLKVEIYRQNTERKL